MTSKAIADVLAERARQISEEGWTPEHDDAYKEGELALAGAVYAIHSATPLPMITGDTGEHPIGWPWDAFWWKPRGPRRDLVKAAALLIAEIERRDREIV